MKPILLKIKGLNSFTDEQAIDFEKLSAKGLFGIFGPTGSGKSSIIDAITMALFGEISRYEGERKNRHFINSLSDTMWVFFQFAVYENGEETVYVAERSYKRSKDTQKVVMARLYKTRGDDIQIICDKPAALTDEVEKLIGLNYKDFSRSVILPQGKFSQFLLLANMDRKNMLERIFGLEKYGDIITGKIKSAYSQGIRQKEIIEKQIEVFDHISEELILKDKEFLTQLTDSLEKNRQQLQIQEKEYESKKSILKLVQDLEEDELILKELLDKKEMIDADIDKEAKGSKALQILPVYNEYKDRAVKYEKITLEETQLKPLYTAAEQRLKETKSAYIKASEDKDSRLPGLIDREVHLKRAIEIKALADQLAPEVKKLREEYKNIKKLLAEALENQGRLQREKQEAETAVSELRKQIQENAVSPELRNQMDSGYMTVLKLKETEKNNEILKQNFTEYETKTAEYTKKYNEISRDIEAGEIELGKAEAQLSALKLNPPVTLEGIADEKEKIIRLGNSLENTREKYVLYKKLISEEMNLKDKVIKLAEIIAQREKALYSYNETLINLQAEFAAQERNHMIHVVADTLLEGEPCPVCGSVHHPAPFPSSEQSKAPELKEAILNKEKEILEASKALSNAQLESSFITDSLLKIQEDIAFTENSIKNFDENKAENHILSMKEKLKALEEDFRKWEEQGRELEILKQKTADSLTSLKLSENKIHETLKKYEELTVLSHRDRDKNDNIIKTLKISLKSLEDTLGIRDFEQNRIILTQKDQRTATLNKNLSELQDRQNNLSKILDKINTEINTMSGRLERIKTLGSEKAALLQDYENEIKKLAGEDEPKLLLNAVSKEIKNVTDSELSLKSLLEAAEKAFDEISQKYKAVAENKKIFENLLDEQKENYENALEKHGFLHEEFNSALITEEMLYILREKIKQYENTLNAKRSSVEGLKAGLQGHDTENIREKTNSAFSALNKLKETIEKMTGDIAVAKENIIKKEENLNKVRHFMTEINELQSKLDILEDLVKLFEGKKFVEYAARRQLEYITRDASKRLKEVSGMRYALELDGTDFIIRDDFNGGIRRSPKTLSGGETFMASLCLALALSAKIQMKSRTSLEFFFLDEGFGSLDSDLLNTVMDSLIKLRMENIKVGIISHVEELKTQIPVKLNVCPPGQPDTGTTVYID